MKAYNVIVFLIAGLLLSMGIVVAEEGFGTVPAYNPEEGFTATVGQEFRVAFSSPPDLNITEWYVNPEEENEIPGMVINVTTGVLTWTPEDRHQGEYQFIVRGVPENGVEALDRTYDLTVEPVLAIERVRAGLTAETLREVSKEGQTERFQPGDNVTFELTLRNKFPDKELRDITIWVNAPLLGEFPDEIHLYSSQVNFDARNSLRIAGGQTHAITFTYQIPYGIVSNEYEIQFLVRGEDRSIPENAYKSEKNIALRVERPEHGVVIKELSWADNDLTCAEKQNNAVLTVDLANVGSNDETVVVEVSNAQLNIREEVEHNLGAEQLGENEPATIKIDPTSVVGAKTFTVKVYRKRLFGNRVLEDEQTIQLTGADCTVGIAGNEPAINEEIILKKHQDETKQFTVTPTAVAGAKPDFAWYVTKDGEQRGNAIAKAVQNTFTLNSGTVAAGNYDVTVVMNAGRADERTVTWSNVMVIDAPLGMDQFNGERTTDLSGKDLMDVQLVLENNAGMIAWTEGVDISKMNRINTVVSITESQVAVDTANAPALNGEATITLKKTFTDPLILRSAGFNSGTFELCGNLCVVQPSAAGTLAFTVRGFSTYRVQERQAASLLMSEIHFQNTKVGEDATVDVTITNTGSATADLHNLDVVAENVDAKYEARIAKGNLPPVLAGGASTTVSVTIKTPTNEAFDKHSIGTLKATALNQQNQTVSVTGAIFLTRQGFLTIDNLQVNGKSSGDLELGKSNDFEVDIRNDYTKDMEDVDVTFILKKVDDGDDLEEDAERFDLDTGDMETVEVSLDLQNLVIKDEEFILEVLVESRAVDGTRHKTSKEFTVRFDLANHEIAIQDASVSASTLQCLRQTTLNVNILNQGQKDEDNVEIRVSNAALDISMTKGDIKVDKFTDRNNDHDESFVLDFEDAQPGNYPINIQVYRGSTKEDSKDVTVTVQDCAVQQAQQRQAVQGGNEQDELIRQLQLQLQQQLQARQNPVTPPATSTFRDTSMYTMLLGVLVVLAFVALILGMMVAMVRKRP